MYNIETMGQTVRENVRRFGRQKGLPFRKLEALAGIGANTICVWGRKYVPGLATVAMVANALEVSVEELLEVRDGT